jgi:hypothetical protein
LADRDPLLEPAYRDDDLAGRPAVGHAVSEQPSLRAMSEADTPSSSRHSR